MKPRIGLQLGSSPSLAAPLFRRPRVPFPSLVGVWGVSSHQHARLIGGNSVTWPHSTQGKLGATSGCVRRKSRARRCDRCAPRSLRREGVCVWPWEGVPAVSLYPCLRRQESCAVAVAVAVADTGRTENQAATLTLSASGAYSVTRLPPTGTHSRLCLSTQLLQQAFSNQASSEIDLPQQLQTPAAPLLLGQ